MPRPQTKEQLKEAAAANSGKLFAMIDSMTGEEQEKTFSFEDRDKNVRDVLVHLYEWHMLLLNWVSSNMSGSKAEFLPSPYNWKTYPAMNIGFWEKHQETSLKDACTLLEGSHKQVMELIEGFTDEELFTKKHFPWTGSTSLGSYCASSTSSHYDWALKKIKAHKKSLTK